MNEQDGRAPPDTESEVPLEEHQHSMRVDKIPETTRRLRLVRPLDVLGSEQVRLPEGSSVADPDIDTEIK